MKRFVKVLICIIMIGFYKLPIKAVSMLNGNGSLTNPYLIQTLADFEYFRDEVNRGVTFENEYFIMTNSIDFQNKPWTPIGTSNYFQKNGHFKGTFDGQGYEITNLYIHLPEKYGVGLFGYVVGGTIKNLIVNGNVTGNSVVSGVVGSGEPAIIENVEFNGQVTGMNDCVGGILGQSINQSLISNVRNYGEITGKMSVGGILGMSYSASQTMYAYNFGNVSGLGNVGGVIGRGSIISIDRSYNGGQITILNHGTTREGQYGGGIAGFVSYSYLNNSFNTGEVVSNASEDAVGGIVGKTLFTTQMISNYSTSLVSSNAISGFIIGEENYNEIEAIKNNYYMQSNIIENQAFGKTNGLLNTNNYGVSDEDFFTGDTLSKYGFSEQVWQLTEPTDAYVYYPTHLNMGNINLNKQVKVNRVMPEINADKLDIQTIQFGQPASQIIVHDYDAVSYNSHIVKGEWLIKDDRNIPSINDELILIFKPYSRIYLEPNLIKSNLVTKKIIEANYQVYDHYVNETAYFTVHLDAPVKEGEYLTVNVINNGYVSYQTKVLIENQTAIIEIPTTLKVGSYQIDLEMSESYQLEYQSLPFQIKPKDANIILETDPTYQYGNDIILKVVLLDHNQLPIQNELMTIKILNQEGVVVYMEEHVLTSDAGIVFLTVPSGLLVGEYTVIAMIENQEYNEMTQQVFEIQKATSILESIPTFEQKNYYEGITVSDFELPNQNFTWKDPDLQLQVGMNDVELVYNPDPTKYQDLIINIQLIVKLSDEMTYYKTLHAAYYEGIILGDIKLDKAYTWLDSNRELSIGTHVLPAIYHSNDPKLNDVTIHIEVIIQKGMVNMAVSQIVVDNTNYFQINLTEIRPQEVAFKASQITGTIDVYYQGQYLASYPLDNQQAMIPIQPQDLHEYTFIYSGDDKYQPNQVKALANYSNQVLPQTGKTSNLMFYELIILTGIILFKKTKTTL